MFKNQASKGIGVMRTKSSISDGIGKFVYYGSVAVLSLLVVLQVFKFWAMDWHALMDEGDAIYHAMVIKTITDTGWHFENPHLGAPGVFQLYDDPVFVTWDSLLIKFLGFLISNPNPIVLYNIYFLLSFPLTAI